MIVELKMSWRRTASQMGRPLGAFTLLALAVAVADRLLGVTWVEIPDLPVSILAATLGILLTFRNNSGYDRWWEARTLWGSIVNASRTFARQALTFLPADLRTGDDLAADGATRRASRLQQTAAGDGGDPASWVRAVGDGGTTRGRRSTDLPHPTDGAVRDRGGAARAVPMAHVRTEAGGAVDGGAMPVSAQARELVYAQIGFVNALRCHLRRQDPIPEITPFFRPAVIEALEDEQNVPAAILVWMSTRLRRAFDRVASDGAPTVDATLRLVALDERLTELTALLGSCERIKNTPIPRQYDLLPRVMVRVYLAMLPFALVRELGLATPIVTAVIGFFFLALDGIGRNVEAPFENDVHDTPMTALCRTVEINLRQMLGESELPPAVQPEHGYLY